MVQHVKFSISRNDKLMVEYHALNMDGVAKKFQSIIH